MVHFDFIKFPSLFTDFTNAFFNVYYAIGRIFGPGFLCFSPVAQQCAFLFVHSVSAEKHSQTFPLFTLLGGLKTVWLLVLKLWFFFNVQSLQRQLVTHNDRIEKLKEKKETNSEAKRTFPEMFMWPRLSLAWILFLSHNFMSGALISWKITNFQGT